MVLPAIAHALQNRRTQRCELGSMPSNTEELRLHTYLMLGRHSTFAGTTTQAVISKPSLSERANSTPHGVELAQLRDCWHWFWTWAPVCKLRTDSTAAKGRDWHHDEELGR